MGKLFNLLALLLVVLFMVGVAWLGYESIQYMSKNNTTTTPTTTESDEKIGTFDSEETAWDEEDEDEYGEEGEEDLLADAEADELLAKEDAINQLKSEAKEKSKMAEAKLADASKAATDGAGKVMADATDKLKSGKAAIQDKFTSKGGSTNTAAADKPKTEVPKDVPAEYGKTVNMSPSDQYMVISGSFTIAENAEKEVVRLKKMGYKNAEAVQFASTKYLSVCVGRYKNEAEARNMAAQTKKELKVDAYVHKKRWNK